MQLNNLCFATGSVVLNNIDTDDSFKEKSRQE